MTTSRMIPGLTVAALALGGLTACGWVESICSSGEYTTQYAEGGADCRTLGPDDPDCPDGRILRKTEPSGRMDCIVDDVSRDPDPVPVG